MKRPYKEISELFLLLGEMADYFRSQDFPSGSFPQKLLKISQSKEPLIRFLNVSSKRINELESLIEVLSIYTELTMDASYTKNLLDVFKALGQAYGRISFCVACSIYLLSRKKDRVKMVHTKGFSNRERLELESKFDIQNFQVLYRDKYQLIPYITEDSGHKRETSLLFLPLKYQNEINGLILLKTNKPAIEVFDNTLNVLQNMADFISVLIENNHLLKRNEILSITDVLTGLFNSRFLDRILDDFEQGSWTRFAPISLIFIDLDGFKSINDNHGHRKGSHAISEVSTLIRDACPKGRVFRYGGDEFVIMLLETETQHAFAIAEEIRAHIASHKLLTAYGLDIQLTASLGISTYPTISKSIKSLFTDADNMMYKAKKSGKNKVFLMA